VRASGRFAWWRVLGLGVVVSVLFVVLFAGWFTDGALAVSAAPAWQVTDLAAPSVLPSGLGKQGKYDVVVENIGAEESSGEFTVSVGVPSGLSVIGVLAEPEGGEPSCTQSASEVSCIYSESIVPSGFVVMQVRFEVTGSVSSLSSVASVSGGGAAAPATAEANMRAGVGSEKGGAGVAKFGMTATGPAGEPVTQAGEHPNFFTTSVLFNNTIVENLGGVVRPVEAVKDLSFYLPIGMLGNPSVTEPCPVSLVETRLESSGCPPASRVGTILPMVLGAVFANSSDPTHVHGIYSVTPEKGYAAEFAFASNHYTFFLYANVVRHDGTYMLRVTTPGVPLVTDIVGLVATFYGDVQEHFTAGGRPVSYDHGAFLTNPSECGAEARDSEVEFNTWENPEPLPAVFSPSFSSITGCGLLGFSAGLSVRPETTRVDSPSGYEVGLSVPQAPNGGSGLGTPPVRDVSVTLPEGTTISPSSANGLEACQETGPEGINIEGGESEEVAADGMEVPAAGHCPLASQIGTVKARTPLLREELQGKLFIAAPQCGGAGQPPCTDEDAEDGKLFGLYLELEGPSSGVIIKLHGIAVVNTQTGRLDVSFDENPQLPFSQLTVSTKQGPRATLANSQVCGSTAVSSAVIEPWSSPSTPSATPEDFFTVDGNGSGGPCPASTPFAPSFTAGTTSPVAAQTSPFTLTLKREDGEQNVASLSSTLPEGLLADVSKATKCPEPLASQASLSACPAASQIGSTTVGVGPGSSPYYVTGKVFFTGPYDGAPFGLSVVVPAVAGPFNLGNVLVRVGLFVNRTTAQATAVSGPLPQILDGVPLQIRTLNVTLEDREFVLNPTSCVPASITGTVYSTTGATAGVLSPYAAAGCDDLAFKPAVSATTEAQSTKLDGTGVNVKIAYPTGGEANIAKVVLSFPKKLPVRLETLQQACRAATFEANPAACPAASRVGSAVVHTPILAQPLVGPAYLVSYGSAQFPDVVFILQGEGVTLQVNGESFVSHSGVLRVTFPSVPDAPFSTFETSLPAGAYSQFTSIKSTGQAKASQCGESLVAPVTMVAHNGAEVSEDAKVQVTGCGASVSITGTHATKRSLTVSVTTSVQGRLRITGKGLKTLVKANLSAGTHKLTLAFTSAGKLAARKHNKIQITVGLVAGKQHTSKHKKVTL